MDNTSKKAVIFPAMCMAACAFLLAACSGDEKAYGMGEEGQGTVAAEMQFEELGAEGWEENWIEETASGDSVNVYVDSTIVVPKSKEMSVVAVRKYEMDNEHKKALVEKVFGAETQYYTKGDSDDVSSIEDGYAGNYYRGERDGTDYRLDFGTGSDYTKTPSAYIELQPCDWKDVAPGKIRGKVRTETDGGNNILMLDEGVPEAHLENNCEMTAAEAATRGENFLNRMGFSNMVWTDIQALSWNVDTGAGTRTRVVEGYRLTFTAGVDGLSFPYFGVEKQEYWEEADYVYNQYSMRCYVTMVITDEGILSVKWENPIETVSVTPNVRLLSPDKAKKIIKSEMGAYAEYFYNTYRRAMKFDRMELAYHRVSDTERDGYFTYVPAWRLTNYKFRRPMLVINAIDGTVIRDWDLQWELEEAWKLDEWKLEH